MSLDKIFNTQEAIVLGQIGIKLDHLYASGSEYYVNFLSQVKHL